METVATYIYILIKSGTCQRTIHLLVRIEQIYSRNSSSAFLDVNAEADSSCIFYGPTERKLSKLRQTNPSHSEKPDKRNTFKTKSSSLNSKRKRKRSEWTVVVTEVVETLDNSNNNSEHMPVDFFTVL